MQQDNNLYGLFADSLKDMLYVENFLPEAYNKLANKASATPLKDALLSMARLVKNQADNLNEIFRLLGEEPDERKCEAIKCIVREARQLADETDSDSQTRDAALIMALKKAGNYKIGSYESLVYISDLLENPKVASMLTSAMEKEQEIQERIRLVAAKSIDKGILAEG